MPAGMRHSDGEYAAVLSQVELLWREMTPEPDRRLAPCDDIFEHGADSFAFVSLMRLVEEDLGVQLPTTEVFEDPTLETIARCVLDQRG